MATYSDPDYDEIEQLIDGDPIVLGRRYRAEIALADRLAESLRWALDILCDHGVANVECDMALDAHRAARGA